jgi:hypothetical protein
MAMPAAPATEPTEATPVAAADGNTALPTAAQ